MIIGFSGSGKSTLARKLGERLNIKPLHFDSIHWLPGWKESTVEHKTGIVAEILKRDRWIIEGNYKNVLFKERIDMCDTFIFIDINRFSCLKNVLFRFFKYHNQTRPDMGKGCTEKIDFEFIKWVLYDGRKSRRQKLRIAELARSMNKDVLIFRSRKQINRWLDSLDI